MTTPDDEHTATQSTAPQQPTPLHTHADHFEEGEEKPPKGVRVMAGVRWLFLAAVMLTALFSVLSYAAPRLRSDASQGTSAAKYYCPMHPQITSDVPGECPICHMSLEPIPKERTAPRSSTPVSSALPAKSGRSADEHRHGAPASAASSGTAASTVPPGTTPITLTLDRVQAINVRTALVESRKGAGGLRVAAIVEASEQSRAEVRVRASGYIEALRVKQVGVKVRAGEVLASFFSPEIFQAQQELLTVNAWPPGASGAEPAPPARKRLELLGVGSGTIARILKTRQPVRAVPISAPISGHVVKKAVVLGSFVMPEAALFEIADLNKVYVIANVFTNQLASIKLGDVATFTTPAAPGRTFEAKVDLIYPEMDLNTRSARIRFQIENKDLALLPGQFGTASFGGLTNDQLTIPLDALIDTGNARYVFVVGAGGRFTPRVVEIGEQVGNSLGVQSGLSAGERVVSGATFLIDAESRLQASFAGGGAP